MDSKLNILNVREKALLGLVEYKLDNHARSFRILKDIDFFDLDNQLSPYVLIAFAETAFEMHPYSDAVFYMSGPLRFVQHKGKYLLPRISKSSEDRKEIEVNKDYWRIISTQLLIGDKWLRRAHYNEKIDDWIKAIDVATEGFIACCNSVNTRENLLDYLSIFNEVLKDPTFLLGNTNKILNLITYYIEILERMKNPSYHIEVLKLKILHNIVNDTAETHIDKYDVYAKEEMEFQIDIPQFMANAEIKSVRIKKNFIINEDHNLLSSGLPSSVFPSQRILLNVEKESTFSKNAVFAFNVIAEDTSSNATNVLLIPSLF